jgi:hypothetical protein
MIGKPHPQYRCTAHANVCLLNAPLHICQVSTCVATVQDNRNCLSTPTGAMVYQSVHGVSSPLRCTICFPSAPRPPGALGAFKAQCLRTMGNCHQGHIVRCLAISRSVTGTGHLNFGVLFSGVGLTCRQPKACSPLGLKAHCSTIRGTRPLL